MQSLNLCGGHKVLHLITLSPVEDRPSQKDIVTGKF